MVYRPARQERSRDVITLKVFFMGRDLTHAQELTEEIIANAKVTVERVNERDSMFCASLRPTRLSC